MVNTHPFTGIWRSYYTYPSSGRAAELSAEQYVRAYQKGNHIVFESVPNSKSYLIVRLTLQDDVATGSWQEHTDPEGYYKGAMYQGAIHMLLSEDKKELQGKWAGVGKDKEVNTGPWSFTYFGENMPA